MLRCLSIEPVVAQTASESQKETSGGADGRERVCGDVLELLQGGVGREGVREVLCRLSIKPVGVQTASKSQKETSGGADSRRTVCSSLLERDQDRILFQIMRQKHRVSNVGSKASENSLCQVCFEST